MRKRARQPPPDLTSLFDVLFIVIFAALIRAAAVQQAAAQPPPAPKPPPRPMDPRSLQARALVDLDRQLAERPAVVVRVTAAGTIAAIESAGKTIALDAPLLEHDPQVKESYLPDRSAELRVCRVVALHLGVDDLAKVLVIVAPDRALADLPHALFDGLHRDVDRCLVEQRGIAAIVGP